MFRKLLAGVVGFGVVCLSVTACGGLFDSGSSPGQQQSDHTTMVFNNDNSAFWIVIVLLVVGLLWLVWQATQQKARADYAERVLLNGQGEARPVLNGRPYVSHRPVGYHDEYRQIGH
jgi:H+/Cl- antiporter ClcA